MGYGRMGVWGYGECKLRMLSPFDGPKHLSVAEYFAKVNVKHLSRSFDHNVIVMTIADPEDIRSNAVPRTRECEIIHRLAGDGK